MSRRKVLAHRNRASGRVIAPTDELLSPTEARRLIDQAAVGLKDATWSTMAGRLYLYGKLGASEYSAAKRWCALTSEYSTACQSPRQPQSLSLEIMGGTPADPDSDAGQREARRHERASAAFLEGRNTLRLGGAAVCPSAWASWMRCAPACGHCRRTGCGARLRVSSLGSC
jgi:hypothetical protein